jgi:hypothetical protein
VGKKITLKLTLTLFFLPAQSASGGLSGLKGIFYLCRQIIDNKELKLTLFSLLKYL